MIGLIPESGGIDFVAMRKSAPKLLARILLVSLVQAGVQRSEAADGLSLSLSCITTNEQLIKKDHGASGNSNCVLASGIPVLLHCSISNNSNHNQFLASSDIHPTPQDFNIRRIDGTGPTSMVKAHRVGRTGRVIRIAPGQSFDFDIDLYTLYPPVSCVLAGRTSLFEAGAYSVTMKLNASVPVVLEGEQLWIGVLESNPLTITIEPPSKQEMENLWRRFSTSIGQEKTGLAALLVSIDTKEQRFLELLSDPSPEIRILSIQAMVNAHRTDDVSISRLEDVLRKDSDSLVRSYAADALGKLGSAKSVPALVDAVTDRQERSYRAAIRALGIVGDERAIKVLKDVASTDSEEWVRNAAKESIEKIRNRSTQTLQ